MTPRFHSEHDMQICFVIALLATTVLCGCASSGRKEAANEARNSPFNKTCKVHHTERQPQVVRIVYGYFQFDEPADRIEQTYFPNAWTFCRGGCVVEPEKSIEVRFCLKCREEQERWRKMPWKQRRGMEDKLMSMYHPKNLLSQTPPRRAF